MRRQLHGSHWSQPEIYTPPAALEYLDLGLLTQHRNMLGPQRFIQLCEQMETQCLELIAQLEAESESRQVELLHKLAGTLSNFGMPRAAACSRTLEQSEDISQESIKQLKGLCLASLASLKQQFGRAA